jgi:outer membrane protein OmpA-like peptidoglycan-associated protein
MTKRIVRDEAALKEYRKILQIKGWLDGYPDTTSMAKNYPRNNYSGLNSLRQRMKGSQIPSLEGSMKSSSTEAVNDSNECIGAPINFFFKLNTATLTSKAQQLNIAEIARVAKKHSLYVRIVGAADKATGTETRNKELSESRAAYISEQLQKRGIPIDNIICEGIGGISRFKPDEINRYTRVMLYSKLPD